MPEGLSLGEWVYTDGINSFLDKEGEVVQVLTGPLAIEELNKRALAYNESQNYYETLDLPEEDNVGVISDYTGHIEDYL